MSLRPLSPAQSFTHSTGCCSPDFNETRIIHRNPRFSLSFQLCKVLEADLGPRFKFINLAHQF